MTLSIWLCSSIIGLRIYVSSCDFIIGGPIPFIVEVYLIFQSKKKKKRKKKRENNA